jgi:histone acetyltransferase (RNA polymerase elongator complex component)
MMPPAKPFIIPIFIPHAGCPHQCAFCNQKTVTSTESKLISPEQFRLLVNGYLNYKGERRGTVQIAFYGGTFLGMEKAVVEELLKEAACFVETGAVDNIRFSTRPDSIDHERLEWIRPFPVSAVELGVQSMDDRVLAMSKRGHTAEDTEIAVRLLKQRNYEIGIQMMTGLPGDDDAGSLRTAKKIIALSPDFVRIYPAVVLENSLLARWYRHGMYSPMPLEKCVTLVKQLYLLFKESGIPVIRMGLQASEDFEKGVNILGGPYHPAFGHLVYSEIFLDKASSMIASEKPPYKKISLIVHPRAISKMQGMGNHNIEILKHKFSIGTIKILPDPGLSEDGLELKIEN